MADWEKTIVPLDDAHEVLGTFGIGPYNKAYERWRREDGFRWVDLEDVLDESPLILNVDWREWLQDALETVRGQLDSLGIALDSDLGDEGNEGHVEIDGARETIKYIPADEDNFDDVVRSINRLIKEKAQYRKFRSCVGSDGWRYGVLAIQDRKALESSAPNTLNLLFVPGS